jgi:hypothetical protein
MIGVSVSGRVLSGHELPVRTRIDFRDVSIPYDMEPFAKRYLERNQDDSIERKSRCEAALFAAPPHPCQSLLADDHALFIIKQSRRTSIGHAGVTCTTSWTTTHSIAVGLQLLCVATVNY